MLLEKLHPRVVYLPQNRPVFSRPAPPGDLKHTALVTGKSGFFSLAHTWAGRLALQGRDVHILDCAMRFDVFQLADEAARFDCNPDILLSAVTVQRVFTPYHILEAVKDMIRHPPEGITFFLAPLKQFFDADVALEEGAYLLNMFCKMLLEINRRGTALFLVEKENYPHPNFPSVISKIRALSAPIWQVEAHGDAEMLPQSRGLIGGEAAASARARVR